MRINQYFVPLGANDTWGLLTQVTSFKFAIFGFKIAGFFNSIFSNYDLNPTFEEGLFSKEIFKIEETANEQTADYWKEIRPSAELTEEEEGKDYVKKDGLRKFGSQRLTWIVLTGKVIASNSTICSLGIPGKTPTNAPRFRTLPYSVGFSSTLFKAGF